MNKVKVLDCTLRDGGYVNNWEFGYKGIVGTQKKLEKANVDVIEMGFLRNESYNEDRSVFNSVNQIEKILERKNSKTIYTGLIEMANYYPPELLTKRNEFGLDAIRYTFWKRKINEAFEYCKIIADKGYKLCVQPTRVEQYSDEEFAQMIEMFNELSPYAVYIVDTFGLLKKKDLIRYAKIAQEHLKSEVILGYHAHNNMQQAFSNATAFVELNLDRDIMIDASVYGMGRGAGNLNLELITNYLNEHKAASYELLPIYETFDEHLSKIFNKSPWGYTLPYYIAASFECNPNYAMYYSSEKKLPIKYIYKILKSIKGEDKYLYSDEKAEFFYKNLV